MQPEEPHLNKPLTIDDQQTKEGEDIVRQKNLDQIITTSPTIPRKINDTTPN